MWVKVLCMLLLLMLLFDFRVVLCMVPLKGSFPPVFQEVSLELLFGILYSNIVGFRCVILDCKCSSPF